jgi:hypothetical protein
MRPLYQRPIAGQKTRTCRHDRVHTSTLRSSKHVRIWSPALLHSGNTWATLPRAHAYKPLLSRDLDALNNAVSFDGIKPGRTRCNASNSAKAPPRHAALPSTAYSPASLSTAVQALLLPCQAHAAAAAGAWGPQLGAG